MVKPKVTLKPLIMPRRKPQSLPAEIWWEVLKFVWSGTIEITGEKLWLRTVSRMFYHIICNFVLVTNEVIVYRNYVFLKGTPCAWLDVSTTLGLLAFRVLVNIWRSWSFEVPHLRILTVLLHPGDILVLAMNLSRMNGVKRIAYSNKKALFTLPTYKPFRDLIWRHGDTLEEVLYLPIKDKVPEQVVKGSRLIRVYPVHEPLDSPRHYITYEKGDAESSGLKVEATSRHPIALYTVLANKSFAPYVTELDMFVQSEFDITLRSTVQVIRCFVIEFPQLETVKVSMWLTQSDHCENLNTIDVSPDMWSHMVNLETKRFENEIRAALDHHPIHHTVSTTLCVLHDITLFHVGKRFAADAIKLLERVYGYQPSDGKECVLRHVDIGHIHLDIGIEINVDQDELMDVDAEDSGIEADKSESENEKEPAVNVPRYPPGLEWIAQMEKVVTYDAAIAE